MSKDRFVIAEKSGNGSSAIFGDLPVCMDTFADMPTGLYWIHDDAASSAANNCLMIHVNDQRGIKNPTQIFFELGSIYMDSGAGFHIIRGEKFS